MIFNYTDILQLLGQYFWPFARISGMLLMVPMYSGRFLDVKGRLVLAMFVTIAIAPSLPLPDPVNPFTWEGVLLVAQQISIGFAIGVMFALVFEAFVLAGHLASLAMGLSLATMLDPTTGVNSPVVGRYYTIVVSLLFLLMHGHILVFKAVLDTFEYLPIGMFYFTPDSLMSIVSFGSRMFEASVLVALPVVTAVLLVNIALGVVGRVVPNMNIFSLGFAITILLGLIMLAITTPLVQPHFESLITEAMDVLTDLRLNK